MKPFVSASSLFKSAFILCVFVLQSYAMNAQIKALTKSDSATIASHHGWFYLSNYQFEVQYPKLNYVPTITSDMPLDIIAPYIVLDSLMRNWDTNARNTCIRWREKPKINDTIIAMVKYLYKIKDYDPIRFNLYKYSTGKLSYVPYQTNLLAIDGLASNLLEQVQTLFSPAYTAIKDLNDADYILKVHVNSVDTLPWIDHPNQFVYGVNATVLDTLKGKVFQNGCNQSLYQRYKKNNNLSNAPCINFDYATGPYSNYTSSRKIDQSLLNSAGNLTLKPGQDIIVTLSHGDHKYDYNYDYFSLSVIAAIPVINGQVIDNGKIWSNTAIQSYSDWKHAFYQRVDMLLNGGY